MQIKNLSKEYRDIEAADTVVGPKETMEVYPSKVEAVLAEGDFEVVKEEKKKSRKRAKKK